jgi:hypothetical protein
MYNRSTVQTIGHSPDDAKEKVEVFFSAQGLLLISEENFSVAHPQLKLYQQTANGW